MRSSLWLSALLLAVLSFNAVKGGPFTVTISTPREQEMGEDVTCQAVISNNHDEDYYLLKRNTPLEKIRSHIFNVKEGRNTLVEYDGFLFKRGSPTEEEYILVPGKTSVSSKVVMSDAYSFDSPSVYSVQLNTQVLYSKSLSAAPLSQPLSSNARHFFLANTGKAPKLTEPEVLRRKVPQEVDAQDLERPRFKGDWSRKEKRITRTEYEVAYNKSIESASAVDSDPDNYETWFGTPTNARKNTVRDVYEKIVSDMSNYRMVLNYYGEHCTDSTFAYTWYNNINIVFCKLYFKAPKTGIDSKMGVIIHEFSHNASDTDDVSGAYGTTGAKNLAATKPGKAITNADNYEYFSETL